MTFVPVVLLLISQGSPPPKTLTPISEATSVSLNRTSWDIEAGGTPDAGLLVSMRAGFSRIGELRVEAPVRDGWLVGGWVGFDAGTWIPVYLDETSVLFGARARVRLARTPDWSVGASASLGGLIGLPGNENKGVLFPLEGRALFALGGRLAVGVAVDLPFIVLLPRRGSAELSVPLTVGFAGELHVLPSFGLTVVLGLGPALDTRGVELAVRSTLGVGFRL